MVRIDHRQVADSLLMDEGVGLVKRCLGADSNHRPLDSFPQESFIGNSHNTLRLMTLGYSPISLIDQTGLLVARAWDRIAIGEISDSQTPLKIRLFQTVFLLK
jgi:hypothetical protein